MAVLFFGLVDILLTTEKKQCQFKGTDMVSVQYILLAFARFEKDLDLYDPGAATIWLPSAPHPVEHNLLILGLLQPGS